MQYVLSGEFKNTTRCEHHIWLVKCKMGEAQPPIQTERANTQGITTLCVRSFSDGFSLEL